MAKKKKKRVGRPPGSKNKKARKAKGVVKPFAKASVKRIPKTKREDGVPSLKGKFIVLDSDDAVLRRNEIGETVFATGGVLEDVLFFTSKADAKAVATDSAAAVALATHYIVEQHQIEIKRLESPRTTKVTFHHGVKLAWDNSSVDLRITFKQALKNAKNQLLDECKAITDESKACIADFGEQEERILSQIEQLEKERAALSRDHEHEMVKFEKALDLAESHVVTLEQKFK